MSEVDPCAVRVKVMVASIAISNNLKVIYQPLYSMNKFVTNKSKLPQNEAQVFPYMA